MVFFLKKTQIFREIELRLGFGSGLNHLAIGIVLKWGIYILEVVPNVRACQVNRFSSAVRKVKGIGRAEPQWSEGSTALHRSWNVLGIWNPLSSIRTK